MSTSDVDLSIIVIAQLAEPNTGQAVDSLLQQEGVDGCEIVVVLHAEEELLDVRLEEPIEVIRTPVRLLPGAARNVGVRAASGHAIAFLAADCLAEPGWIAGRIALHRRGVEVVASAMTIAPPRTIAGWASHYALFPGRLRGRPAGYVRSPDPAAHGLSFRSQVLRELGPFREDLRISEDSEMASRLSDGKPRIWFDPSIRTAHRAPRDVGDLLRDSEARGRRSGAHAVRSRGHSIEEIPTLRKLWWWRTRFVFATAWRCGAGERWRIVLVAPWIALATGAYQLGWIRGMRASAQGSPADPKWAP